MTGARVRDWRGMEELEGRQLLTAASPTNYEQYLLELINRARANPAAEAARYGIDLNEGLAPGTISADPKQPLAMNPFLVDAARNHSADMIAHDYFGHTGSDGSSPQRRMADAGYIFDPTKTRGSGENLAFRGEYPSVPVLTTTTAQEHQDLFLDSGVAGRGHRLNMMNGDFKEVGMGIATGEYTDSRNGQTYNAVMATQDFAYVLPSAFLTGVAYVDNVVKDHFYTPGEGLGALTITATRASDGATFSTSTFSTGGYSLALVAGTYTVTASGGSLSSPITYDNVVIGSENVKRDFVPAAPVTPPAKSPPTAKAKAASITRTGGKTSTFTVTYSDENAVSAASIGTGDVVVTGPKRFKQVAKLISRTPASDSGIVTAIYRIVAPGKKWDAGDNGIYSISLVAKQVKDVGGLFAAAGKIGAFKVNIRKAR